MQRRERDETQEQNSISKKNNTGLPDRLKAGVEKLSGISLDDVRVHYHSSQPSQLQALAYTQGTEIHVGSGQEQHLAHEAWHVVQQKQGRVQPSFHLGNTAINDDASLEREADGMGRRVLQFNADAQDSGQAGIQPAVTDAPPVQHVESPHQAVAQRMQLRGKWTYKGRDISARTLVRLLNEQVTIRNAVLAVLNRADPFIGRVQQAHRQATPAHGGEFNLSGTSLQIAPNMYMNLRDDKEADTIYSSLYPKEASEEDKTRIRGGGPNYAEIRDALAHYVAGGAALPSKEATNKMSDAQIARQIRALLGDPDTAGVHPVLAHATAVAGGAEGLRNPRATASLAMFADLVESGEATLAEGFGPGINDEQATGHHLDQLDRAEFFGVYDSQAARAKLPINPKDVEEKEEKKKKLKPAEKRKQRQDQELYDYALKRERSAAGEKLDEALAELDLNRDWKQSATLGESLRGFGGAIPMVGAESAGEGSEPIPAEGDKTRALNLVQAKEATLIARWLDVQIRRMGKEELASFDEMFKANPNGAIRNLLRMRLGNLGQSFAADPEGKSSSMSMSKGSMGSGGRMYQLTPHQVGWLVHHQRQDVPVPGNGDCFFESLRRVLTAQGVNVGSVQQMRTTLAGAIRQDVGGQNYPFIPHEARDAIASSIATMGDYANFAGDVTPMLAAARWGLSITIIDENREIPVGDGNRQVFLIRFSSGTEHYHATEPVAVAANAGDMGGGTGKVLV